MSYVDENLLPGERITYRARLHPIIYSGPVALAVAGAALVGLGLWRDELTGLTWVGAVLLVGAAILGVSSWMHSSASEFAVTNRRVVIKVGFIRRHTVELLLQQVEGIGVDQTVLGRVLNLGSIVVIGTGGTREQFKNIADPLKFRHQVQAQTADIMEPQQNRVVQVTPGGPFCVSCGAQNPAEALFCFKCGQRLQVG